MNIVTSLNRLYLRYTVVMLTSLCIHHPEETVEVYVLHHELSDEDFQEMRTALRDYRVAFHSLRIDRDAFSDRIRVTDMWSMEAYYRLMLPNILPDTVGRVLYLDVDLIINKCISEFYYVDFGEYEIIATQDSGGRIPWDGLGEFRKKMFAPMIEAGYRYINSGVMLMNMDVLRERYSFEVYRKAMEEWDYKMVAPDQDIINFVHWKNIGYVDADYYDLMVGFAHAEGMTYEEAGKKVAILHYSGPKPWHNKNFHFPIQQIWWDYAAKTPYYTELLEEFVRSAMFDPTVERIMTEYANGKNEADELREKLKESLELNQKMIQLVESGMSGGGGH